MANFLKDPIRSLAVAGRVQLPPAQMTTCLPYEVTMGAASWLKIYLLTRTGSAMDTAEMVWPSHMGRILTVVRHMANSRAPICPGVLVQFRPIGRCLRLSMSAGCGQLTLIIAYGSLELS